MKYPTWFEVELAKIGGDHSAGIVTRQEAITALRDKINAAGDSEFLLGILAGFASKSLDTWSKKHAAGDGGSRRGMSQEQSDLFPSLPARMYIAPDTRKPVILFTGHDWDMARNMTRNRTDCAKRAAEQDWTSFQAAYDRVRPLLSGDLTTAEVAEELRRTA